MFTPDVLSSSDTILQRTFFTRDSFCHFPLMLCNIRIIFCEYRFGSTFFFLRCLQDMKRFYISIFTRNLSTAYTSIFSFVDLISHILYDNQDRAMLSSVLTASTSRRCISTKFFNISSEYITQACL